MTHGRDGQPPVERNAPDEQPTAQPDVGLRQLLTYVLVALVLTVILAVLAVDLVMRWWGPGR